MKKRRTRQHIIEDLGLNHVERQVLLAGYTLNKVDKDYGYDFLMNTYNENGEVDNGLIFGQLKSTDHIKTTSKGIAFSLSKRDLELWLLETSLMILVIYDAQLEKAYYLILKDYFEVNKLQLQNVNKYIQIHISVENVFNIESVKALRNKKAYKI